MKKNNKKIIVLAITTVLLSPNVYADSVTSSVTSDSFKDPGCSNTIKDINDTVKKKVDNFKKIQKDTAVKSSDFLNAIKGCLGKLGAGFHNPFSKPGDLFKGWEQKICNKALDKVSQTTQPYVNKVNGTSITAPYGLFKYNPNIVDINRSGHMNFDTKLRTDSSTSDQLWNAINK